MMNKWFSPLAGLLLIVLVAVIVLLVRQGASSSSNTPAWNATDPQTLMIPRWFLKSLILDGNEVAVGDQRANLQFEEDGKANGEGGCNSFFATYQVNAEGELAFGPVGSTKMACADGMDLENAYFTALSRVEQFRTAEGQLTLSSKDGKTVLIYAMPPK